MKWVNLSKTIFADPCPKKFLHAWDPKKTLIFMRLESDIYPPTDYGLRSYSSVFDIWTYLRHLLAIPTFPLNTGFFVLFFKFIY